MIITHREGFEKVILQNSHSNKENAVYRYNGILLSHQKNEIWPFAMTWTELESIMPSDISQRKTNAIGFPHMWNLRNKRTNVEKKG